MSGGRRRAAPDRGAVPGRLVPAVHARRPGDLLGVAVHREHRGLPLAPGAGSVDAGNPVGPVSEVLRRRTAFSKGSRWRATARSRTASTTSDMNLWAVDGPSGRLGRGDRSASPRTSSAAAIPITAPDGRVAFAAVRSGTPHVRLVDRRRRDERRAASSPRHLSGTRSGSATGGILVRTETPTPASFWWLDPRTRRVTLARALEPDISNARPSPDGRELAFHVIEATGVVNVWTQPLEGDGPRRRVTSDAEVMSYPAWSPDGRWLAVEIKRGDQTHVGVVSRDGGAAEQLTVRGRSELAALLVARRRAHRVRRRARRRLERLAWSRAAPGRPPS